MMAVEQEDTLQTVHNTYEMIDCSSRFNPDEKIKRFENLLDSNYTHYADLTTLSLKDRLKAMQGLQL